ncbi:MAG: clan AA aspartic protease [Acidobacteria bacterium]|nr:MAG: clan AA aspartic protease [Acidobacteriota bacterium]
MLTGRINSKLEAVVSLWIGGPEGRSLKTDVIVDTGFSGTLLVPREVIASLGLLPYGMMVGTLADGRERFFPVCTAIISWLGKPRLINVNVVEESEPLLGMGMLHGYELAMQVVEGGEVAIRDLG